MLNVEKWKAETVERLCKAGREGKARKLENGDLCGARTRKGTPCLAPGLGCGERCKHHGGMSTGARTSEGKARQLEGLKRYWARMRGEGAKRVASAESRQRNREGQLRRWARYRARKAWEARYGAPAPAWIA